MEQKGQKHTLEILEKVDRISRINHINYTLLFDTLLSQNEENGNSEWLSDIFVGLLYPDYKKLLEIVENGKENELYIINKDNSKDFNAFFSKICMRSEVRLPEDRKEDSIYYDYYIYVYPIIFAGNNWFRYVTIKRRLNYFQHCIGALAPVPYKRGITKKIRTFKQYYWYKKREKKEKEIQKFLQTLLEYGMKPAKYVVIPGIKRQTGIVNVAETYMNVENVKFKNMEVMSITKRNEWLGKYYDRKTKKKIMNKPVNRAIVEGPETIRRVQLIAMEILCEFDRICRKYNITYILSAGTLLGAIRHKGFIPWDDDIDVFMLNEEWQKFLEVAPKELDTERFFLRTQKTDADNNLVFGQIKRNNTVYFKGKREQFNTHRGIAMDILPFYNSPNSRVMFFIQDRLCHFFKSMTWAHMGYTSVEGFFPKLYYRLLAGVSNKKSFQMYYAIANMVKKPQKFLSYLCVSRNPYHKGFNQRKYFEDLCEVKFEGHTFLAPKEYDMYLKELYGKDYLRLPAPYYRINHHLPGNIDLGGLYDYDK